MGFWQISADTLAGSRFTVSPLAEVIACLKQLHRGSAAHPGERDWLGEWLPAYRARLAADPVTELLVRAALGRTWNADFLTPAPAAEGECAFAEEVAAVRATPPADARDDLEVSLAGPLPAALRRDDLPERLAGLLEWIWTEAVRADWPRRRRILEADIVARTAQLTQGGWAAALDVLRPGMRWLGGSRLRINMLDYPPRDLSGAQLMFVPVTPGRSGWVAWDEEAEPRRYAVVYPCAGMLAADGVDGVPSALGALLGSGRARVLVLLGTPKSTTQLTALTEQGLGSVGRHLKVLYDAGLVRRRRAGRSVLYFRTEAGDALVAAQGTAPGAVPERGLTPPPAPPAPSPPTAG